MTLTKPRARDRLLARLRRQGWLTRRDVDAEHIHPRWLRRLQDEGVIERVRRGVYRAAEAPSYTNQTLFEACAAVPRGVVCMASALAYHALSTVNPSKIEMAIPNSARKPVVAYPPIRFYEFRDMATGLERHASHGRELRIFNAERTICDLFRFRRALGKDIALEALQTYVRRGPRAKVSSLMATAHTMGVDRVIRPYVVALV